MTAGKRGGFEDLVQILQRLVGLIVQERQRDVQVFKGLRTPDFQPRGEAHQIVSQIIRQGKSKETPHQPIQRLS